MSTITLPTLRRISADSLRTRLLETPLPSPALAIIDVRDSDHVGGHIKGSQHVPSSSHSWTMAELVRKLQSTKTVVFHCALSQQRGPGAALKYLRERERLFGEEKEEGKEGKEEEEAQEVFVLDQGFVGWQEKYGADETLTEGWNKELWAEEGY